jgi:DNA polymerase III delta prime subunit
MLEKPFEQYRKKQEQQKVEAYRESTSGIPPTVEEILSDRLQSNLLKIYIETTQLPQGIDKDKLLEKLLNRQTLEKAEFDFLEQARSKIKECLDATKEVLDLLPKERIEYLASISPEFRQIVNQIGVEKTRTFLENYLAELYMLNQDNFKELREKLENIKKEEQTYESLNAQVRALAQEYNIPIEELSRVYASGGNLQELVRAHLGIIGKLRDMFGGEI